jgi:hypothetical protein
MDLFADVFDQLEKMNKTLSRIEGKIDSLSTEMQKLEDNFESFTNEVSESRDDKFFKAKCDEILTQFNNITDGLSVIADLGQKNTSGPTKKYITYEVDFGKQKEKNNQQSESADDADDIEVAGTVEERVQLANKLIHKYGYFNPTKELPRIDEGKGTPLENANLSVRAFNVLKRSGITTVEQLLTIINRDNGMTMMRIRNLGPKGAMGVKDSMIASEYLAEDYKYCFEP